VRHGAVLAKAHTVEGVEDVFGVRAAAQDPSDERAQSGSLNPRMLPQNLSISLSGMSFSFGKRHDGPCGALVRHELLDERFSRRSLSQDLEPAP